MNHQSETVKCKSAAEPHLVHSWMNPSCEKRPTPCGYGLVARERIPSGSLILVQGGHVTPINGTGSISEEIWNFPIQITDEFQIGTKHPHEIEDTDFINHSCDPNAGWKGQIFLAAMCDIEADEEIRFDYAMAVSVPGYGFDCICGSRNCRGHVDSRDWMVPEIQERYRGWFQYYLQAKIDAANSKTIVSETNNLPSRPKVPISIRDSGAKELGVFADSYIPHGTHVFTLTGQTTDYDTICQLVDSGGLRNDDPFHIGEGIFLVCDSLSNLFNHSCDPNLGVRHSGELFALRDILPAEELCYDYSTTVPPGWTSADWSMQCHCGTAMCRGMLGDVLTLPSARLEYYRSKGALTDHVLHHLPPST
jgi:SET domain-containing protein